MYNDAIEQEKTRLMNGDDIKTYAQPYTIPGITMNREDDDLIITLEHVNGSNYQLLVGSKPTLADINQAVAQSDNGKFKVTLPVEKGPYYFTVKADNFQTNIFSERVLQLEQAINVRDLGGYETNDGKVTRWGLLYRGDQLSKLVEEDIDILERIGLTSIVDYRSKHECTLNPNKVIGTVKQVFFCDPKSSFSEAAAKAIDLHSENVNLVKGLENGEVEEKYINGKGDKVIESYCDLVTSEYAQDAYGRFLKVCANPDHAPLLFHCRGGKDRTGFGAMLLLMLLGVKREQIVKDYVTTGIIRTARNQLKYDQYAALTSNQDYLDYLMSLIETRSEYIEASMNRIVELFGTVEEYMNQHFGITKEEIEVMKTFYLEEGVR